MERLAVAPDALERAEELIDLEKVRDHVAAALDALNGDVREAVVLRVVQGLSTREAARLAGCSEDLMRQRVSRGLKRLARDLAVLRDTRRGPWPAGLTSTSTTSAGSSALRRRGGCRGALARARAGRAARRAPAPAVAGAASGAGLGGRALGRRRRSGRRSAHGRRQVGRFGLQQRAAGHAGPADAGLRRSRSCRASRPSPSARRPNGARPGYSLAAVGARLVDRRLGGRRARRRRRRRGARRRSGPFVHRALRRRRAGARRASPTSARSPRSRRPPTARRGRSARRPASCTGTAWQWTSAASAAQNGGAVLRGLAALAPNNVWAVGSVQGAPFATHWNGATLADGRPADDSRRRQPERDLRHGDRPVGRGRRRRRDARPDPALRRHDAGRRCPTRA